MNALQETIQRKEKEYNDEKYVCGNNLCSKKSQIISKRDTERSGWKCTECQCFLEAKESKLATYQRCKAIY